MLLRASFTVLALVGLVSITGCDRANVPVEEAKGSSSTATPVQTVAVEQQELRRTTSQPATVHAYQRAAIRARVAGYIAKLNADIGDYVEEGQSLAEIAVPGLRQQRRIIEARIDRFRAMEAQAKAGVDVASAKLLSAEARLRQAESEMDRVDATLQAAEAEFERTQDLVSRQAIERRIMDEVTKKRDSERANRSSVASAIESARADVGVAQASRTAAESDLVAARAETVIAERQLDEMDVLLDYSLLPAPFSGVVTARHVDVGDLVTNSDNSQIKALFELNHVDKLRVQVPVPEIDAAMVSKGDKIELKFPSFPNQSITTTVSRVAGGLDPKTRTMLVEAELDNTDRRLLPGMFGFGVITLQQAAVANVLPARSVRFDEAGNAYVYVVHDDQSVAVVDVETGMDDGSQIEIVSGVESGQRVIDAHLKRFLDGQQVRVLPN